MKTTAALPALDTRSAGREHPQPDWIRPFILCAGFILLAGALNRFLIAVGDAQVLALPESMLGVPLRYAVLAVGFIELPVALFCLFGKRRGLQLIALACLSTTLVIYWAALLWQNHPLQTSCIGSLTDPLRLYHGVTGYVLEFFPPALALGAYAACSVYWLSPAAKSTENEP